jgi:hypothetical protein
MKESFAVMGSRKVCLLFHDWQDREDDDVLNRHRGRGGDPGSGFGLGLRPERKQKLSTAL